MNPISNALYTCGAVACIADMVGKENLKRHCSKETFYARAAIAGGAIVKGAGHSQDAVTQNLRPFSASLR